ncbi:MAG: hypothetical protein HYR64_01080 [Fimbriimonas ginsengisoli]|uniref:Uncharacterized protein n=1 Tax=Fimbriimonas ginsengisoli TaxID=1005039 RepID=A0A931PUY8_FIMGI|nr:hypothetical protein [Fimbriimonas ginsengisoli]
MRSDLLQAAALCCHGNVFLSCGDPSADQAIFVLPPRLASSSFERTSSTEGVHQRNTPAEWLVLMREEGVKALRLDLEGCAFGGQRATGETWGLLTSGQTGLEIWEPRQATEAEPEIENIPSFAARRLHPWSLRRPPTLDEAHQKLAEALSRAQEFCNHGVHRSMALPLDRCVQMHLSHCEDLAAWAELFPPLFAGLARAEMASAIRTLTVLSSPAWAHQQIGEEQQPELVATTMKLWHAARLALEAASAVTEWCAPELTSSRLLPHLPAA